MKKLLLLFCCIIGLNTNIYAQEALTYSKVIQVEGISKNVIYTTLLDWIQTNYRGVKNDSQLSDKEAGYIMKDAAFAFIKKDMMYQCWDGLVVYKMKFQIKDGRFKVELLNFIHETLRKDCTPRMDMGLITDAIDYGKGGALYKGPNNKMWKELQSMCEKKANELFSTLENIDFNKFSTTDDDW